MLSTHFYLSVALALIGLGLFQFRSLTARKSALLCLWLASGGIVWALTSLLWVGLLALALWVMFPLSEMIFVLRRLRLPRRRTLDSAHPPFEDFPELRELTTEMEALGFQKVDDCALTPSAQEQFYRLFVHPTDPIHAFIGFISHGSIGFHFVAFSSEDRSGDQWVTWDYPLSYGLMMPPQVMLYRVREAETVADLHQAHRDFLSANNMIDGHLISTPDASAVRQQIEKTMSNQFEYNLQTGILRAETHDEESFRYSWRGAFYVASQVMRDLVRL